jgi:hypothetical protein
MVASWPEARTAFTDAAGWFLRTVALVDDRWAGPGLGEWDVRALVGHTNRALLTVENYLARPAATVEVATAVDYLAAIRTVGDPAEVAARGRDAGEALGPEPAAAVAALAERVLALVGTRDGSELLTTIAGGMRLVDYLPTRTFELVVHTLDLARALSAPLEVPARPAAQALALVADLAVTGGRAGDLLLLATGRPGPAAGFSVL